MQDGDRRTQFVSDRGVPGPHALSEGFQTFGHGVEVGHQIGGFARRPIACARARGEIACGDAARRLSQGGQRNDDPTRQLNARRRREGEREGAEGGEGEIIERLRRPVVRRGHNPWHVLEDPAVKAERSESGGREHRQGRACHPDGDLPAKAVEPHFQAPLPKR
ncbi:hypothetical protein D3C72_806030 [compost metagenome]